MDEERLVAEIESIKTSLSLLAQRVEVQAAGEAGYRALALEKLETLKLSVQTSALLQMQEATKHYDARIMSVETVTRQIENKADQHIKACEDENERLERNRGRRLNQIYALWGGLILLGVATAGQYIMKSIDPTDAQIIRRLERAEKLLEKQP